MTIGRDCAAPALFWISVGMIFYTYLGYPALMWLLARLHGGRRPASGSQGQLPSVSLVVAAYNEHAVIKDKVTNALALDYPADRLEILIGSDGSSDGTVEAARSILPSARGQVLDLPRQGKALTVNTLVARARGDIIVFSDANTLFEAQALRELLKPFSDSSIGCASGLLHLASAGSHAGAEGESFYWRYETFKKMQEDAFHAVAGANGAIFAIRKQHFRPLTFRTINDDFTISMTVYLLGGRIALVPEARGHETTAPDLPGEFRRHVRDSAGHFRAIIDLKGLLNPFLGMPMFCYVSHRVIRWIVPFFMLSALATSAALFEQPFYRAMFLLQAAVYLACALATPRAFDGKDFGILRIPYYFVLVNFAIVLGFLRFLSGSQHSLWEPTARA